MDDFHVVLADDDACTRRLLETYLIRAGFTVFTCADGDDAFRLVQRHKPVILLVDWKMPGVSGPELCRKIRQSDMADDVYVILITSNSHPKEIAVGLDAGANDYLTKPVSPTVLNARVRVGERVLQLQVRQRNYARSLESEITKRGQVERAMAARAKELEQRTIELEKSRTAVMGMMEERTIALEESEFLRKSAEEVGVALRSAKDFTTSVISSMVDMLVVVAPDGTIRMANDATSRVLGYADDALIGQPVSILFAQDEDGMRPDDAEEDAAPLECAVLRCFETDDAIRNVARSFRAKSGRTIPVLLSGSVMRDISGTIQGVVCVAHDITERKRSERALRESEEKFKSISASAQDAIIMMDADGNISYWNEAAETIFGFTREEVLGKCLHSTGLIVPKRFHGAHWSAWPAFQKSGCGGAVGKTVELVGLRKDGTEFPVELSLSAVRIKKRWHAIGLLRDITERKRAEAELRKLSVAVEQSPASVVITDTQGTIEYVNPRFTEVTGYSANEAIGKNPRILKSDRWSKKAYRKMWQTILAGRVWTGEFENKTKSGAMYWEAASISPIRDEDGSITHFLAVKQDITERKRVEASLRKTETELRKYHDHLEELVSYRTKDLARINDSLLHEIDERREAERAAAAASSAKGDFLATMSHELRTPLHGIIGMTELLLGSGLTREQKRQAGLVKASGDILLRLINDILDFSKIEAGKLQLELIEFDLRENIECVATLLRPQAEQKGLELTVGLNPAVPAAVLGDPGRLQQILTNLVSNAIKFTEEGQIVIRAAVDDEDDQTVSVRISVTDTGIGIPENRQESLFQSFSQLDASHSRRFGGTGLGLAISKQLVEMMGGEIGAISESGPGSTFWFSLTLEKGQGTNNQMVIPNDLRRARILAVDDNATNREILDGQLTQLGFTYELVSDAARALAALRKASAAEDSFALAIIDLQMPDLDGEWLAREVKADPNIRDTVLLLLTSAGIIGDEERMRALGFSGWLAKPTSLSQLLDAMTQAVVCARVDTTRDVDEVSGVVPTGTAQGRMTDARILAAEDNDIGQEVLRQVLSQAGYAFEIVATGRQAVEAWRSGGFDLILMDCQMPEMDGFEATREIRRSEKEAGRGASASPRIPIVALTANALKGDREKCLAAGMDDHAPKPFEPSHLVEVIEAQLANKEKNLMSVSNEQPTGPERGVPATGADDSAPHQAAPAPFDRDAVLKRWGGDQGFAQMLIDKFLAQAPAELELLTQCMAGENVAETTRLAHGLKGAAGYCGAEPFRAVAARLEQIGRAGSLSGADACLDELKIELDRCRADAAAAAPGHRHAASEAQA